MDYAYLLAVLLGVPLLCWLALFAVEAVMARYEIGVEDDNRTSTR